MLCRALCLAPLLLALLSAPRARAEEPPAAEPLEVRLLPDSRVILSQGKTPLAAVYLRAAAAGQTAEGAPAGVLDLKEDWAAAKPMKADGEDVRIREFAPAGVEHPTIRETISILLRVRRVHAGTRILISPARVDATGEAKPRGTLPDLELALELFPDGLKRWPELSALDAAISRGPVQLPREIPKPDGRTVFRATRLSFARKDHPRIELARSGPADWTLFKLGDDALLLKQTLRPDPRDPALPGTFELFVGNEMDGAPPTLAPLKLSKRRTPVGDFVEGALRIYASGADPYGYDELSVVAEIQPIPRGDEKDPAKILVPCYFREGPSNAPAEGEFRFRFAPPKEGAYTVQVLAVAPGGLVRTTDEQAFQAGPAASPGFVRAKPGERVLRFDSGQVFFPVGLNLAWPAKRNDAAQMRERFVELARNGGTAARFWLSSWGLSLERERAGVFDPDAAEALDEILLAAQARGLYLILVAENAHDLTALSARHPYFRELGGPLTVATTYFTDLGADQLMRRRLTYLAARYGAYRSVLAWELFNELDEAHRGIKIDPDDPKTSDEDADRARRARREVAEWTQRLSQHLSGVDAHGHPVTVSLALPPEMPWAALDKIPGITLLQSHGYLPQAADARDDAALDETAILMKWAASAREAGRPHKPYFLGEFGYQEPHDEELAKGGAKAKELERNYRDRDGVLLHNSLMAGLASGMAAAPMLWWWDRAVEPHDLWSRFKGPGLFAAALSDLATREGPANLRALTNEAETHAGVRVLGRVGASGACIWLQDRRSTWSAALERNEEVPPEIATLTVHVPAPVPGAYRVRWLDVWSGADLKEDPLSVELGENGKAPVTLDLKVPPFRRDLALIIELKR